MWNPSEDKQGAKRDFPMIYRAVVVDNVDTLLKGRVKVRVYPMMKDLDEAVLPWAIPATDLLEGGKASMGSYTVPSVDAHIWIFFEMGEVRHPVYFAGAPAKVHGPLGTMDPDVKLWVTRSGHQIEINDKSGEETIKITHKDGEVIELTTDTVKLGKGTLRKLVDERFASLFNSHKHSSGGYIAPAGGGPVSGTSGTPGSSMGNDHMTTDTKGS